MNSLLGIVAIGRNEGERLQRCIDSALHTTSHVVYVDSGSSDDSVSYCQQNNIVVVCLDMSQPFTAARARNEGFDALIAAYPNVEFIQFIDGDCELQMTWVPDALNVLTQQTDVAIVCGRRRERFPEASVYNALCDIEWDTPVGYADACGGDFMVKRMVYTAVNGFNPAVIAGEEPELCYRIRQAGHHIMRLDTEMTLHDANMMTSKQWWLRVKRAGYAYALVSGLHIGDAEKIWLKPTVSALAWGACLPLMIVISSLCFSAWLGFGLLSGYLLLAYRVYRATQMRVKQPNDAMAYTLATVVGKFAEAQGVLKCFYERMIGRQANIIEYKS